MPFLSFLAPALKMITGGKKIAAAAGAGKAFLTKPRLAGTSIFDMAKAVGTSPSPGETDPFLKLLLDALKRSRMSQNTQPASTESSTRKFPV